MSAARPWRVLLFGLLLLPVSGCTGFLDWSNASMASVVWRKNGFSVEDKRREFEFDADEDRETLEFDGQVIYVDLNRDGKVDTYEKRTGGKHLGKWTRGEPGTEELFVEADEAFADARAMLAIDERHATWSSMSEADKARGHGYGAQER